MLADLNKLIDRLKPKNDDDVIDRMNYLHTCWMLIVAALLVLAKQYVGESIQCWVPKHFSSQWEQYIESYCFVENTYYQPVEMLNKTTPEQRKAAELPYYQWVPFFLIGMVFVFLVPRYIWRSLNWRSGLNISLIVRAAMCTEKKNTEKMLKEDADLGPQRKDHINITAYMASMILWNIEEGRRNDVGRLGHVRKSASTSYVTMCYLFFKLMNLTNSLFQLYAINVFLGPQYNFWGAGVLYDLILGRQWHASGVFPRVTFCDITQIRLFGGVKHTVQCVLMLNLFNEKIFILLWFWLAALSFFNLLNLVYWTVISFTPQFENNFVRSLLEFEVSQTRIPVKKDEAKEDDPKEGESKKDESKKEEPKKEEPKKDESKEEEPEKADFKEDELTEESLQEEELTKFVRKCLRKDGITVLRLISDNCGTSIASAIAASLWRNKTKIDAKCWNKDAHSMEGNLFVKETRFDGTDC